MDGVGGVSGADAGAGAADAGAAGAGAQAAGTGADAGASNNAAAGNAAGTDAASVQQGATQDKPVTPKAAMDAAVVSAMTAQKNGTPAETKTESKGIADTAAGRVAGKAVEGLREGWGDRQLGLGPQTVQALRDYNVFSNPQHNVNIIHAFNEVLIGGGVQLADSALRGINSLYYGAANTIGQLHDELGLQLFFPPGDKLANDLKALPQALGPMSFGVVGNTAKVETAIRANAPRVENLAKGASSTEQAAAKSEALTGSNPVASAPIKTLEEAAPKAPAAEAVAETAGGNSADLIAQRVAANALLRESPQFAKDMAKVGVTDAQIARMWAKEAPLGFENAQQFNQFKTELDGALRKAGLQDAEVGLKGTATTFYSENPGKQLRHHWDADPLNKGDYDLNIASPTMVQQFRAAGIEPSKKYGIFKTSDINANYAPLDEFKKNWSKILGRDVNFVGYPGTATRDATEYLLRKP